MMKNLKYVVIILGIIFLSSSLALPVDKDKALGEKTADENIPEAKEVPIPQPKADPLQNYHMPWSCLNGGGLDNMYSSSYKAMASSAQSCIGLSQSTNFQMQIGYWYGGKPFVCGDVNGTGDVSVSDIVYLISYLIKFGQEPDPLYCGDTNGDGNVSISDIVYLVAYVFKGGAPPVC
jgi:hypothetical protein